MLKKIVYQNFDLGPRFGLMVRKGPQRPIFIQRKFSLVLLAINHLSMYCDHHILFKIPDGPYILHQGPILGLWGPPKWSKNQLLCLWCQKLQIFRTYYYTMQNIISTEIFQLWGRYAASKGPQKVLFMRKSSLLILAVALPRSLIVSSLVGGNQ